MAFRQPSMPCERPRSALGRHTPPAQAPSLTPQPPAGRGQWTCGLAMLKVYPLALGRQPCRHGLPEAVAQAQRDARQGLTPGAAAGRPLAPWCAVAPEEAPAWGPRALAPRLEVHDPLINSCYELVNSQDCSESATFEESRSLHVSQGVIFRSRRSHPVQLLAGRPLKPSPRLFH